MNPQIAEVIQRLAAEAAENATHLRTRQAAALTGGVPVYEDWTGVLMVTPSGGVVYYDEESRRWSDVVDPQWQTIALVAAATKHPELGALRPTRPAKAI